MNDREDAKILRDAFGLRSRYGDEAERMCQSVLDTSLSDARRWSIAYRVKDALKRIGRTPASY